MYAYSEEVVNRGKYVFFTALSLRYVLLDTPQDEFDVSMACEGLFTVANLATQDLFLIFCGDWYTWLLDNTGTIGDNVGSWEYDETTGVINADDNYDNDGVAAPSHANL